MARLKKFLFTSLSFVAGLLLTLAGLDLIQLSPDLILYVGIGLLALSIIFYLWPDGLKKEV